MNKEKLMKLKSGMDILLGLKVEMNKRKEAFVENNKPLLAAISLHEQNIVDCKAVLKENAIAGFNKDGLKKRLGGVGIQERTSFNYAENDAIDWAKINSPIMIKPSLDKKTFEAYIKTNFEDLSFVKKEDKIIVTFPKVIKLDEEDESLL